MQVIDHVTQQDSLKENSIKLGCEYTSGLGCWKWRGWMNK